MTTQELFNEATELVKLHGFTDPLLNVHNTCNKYGITYSIVLLNGELIQTSDHSSPIKALIALHTLLTELKAKSCIQDNPNP